MPHDKAALPTTSLTGDLGIQHTSCTAPAAEDRDVYKRQADDPFMSLANLTSWG